MWALLPTKAAMAAPITRMSSSLSPSATAGRAGGGDGASLGAFVSASFLTIAAVGTGDAAAASSAATRSPRRLNSRLRPSRASATLVRSTVSDFMTGSRLQWDQAVLLRRPVIALGLKVFQGLRQVLARIGRLDNIIDQAAASGDVGGREGRAVLLDQLGATRGLVVGCLHLLAEDDLDGAFGPHDGDLGGWPGKNAIGPQVLRAHGQMCAAVGLAKNDLDLGHCGRRIGEEHLGAVANNPAMLLLHAGHESGHVHERDQWNVERVAEADEPARLDRRVDVDGAGEHRGLVGDDPDRAAQNPREADEHVWRIAGLDLEEVPLVHDA